ncbi:hypothetical protein GWI33_020737 [Rhynchophorus ferrugineus]|uniref:Uncharacterized protein n=1 Tax=Rhynchophorus ferrugineus TaxID=354439 RepID=A0A834HW42_RHYFE|nr:hypothetical protein GWI33_020737 [Rhynchophorus ferrugineus]
MSIARFAVSDGVRATPSGSRRARLAGTVTSQYRGGMAPAYIPVLPYMESQSHYLRELFLFATTLMHSGTMEDGGASVRTREVFLAASGHR